MLTNRIKFTNTKRQRMTKERINWGETMEMNWQLRKLLMRIQCIHMKNCWLVHSTQSETAQDIWKWQFIYRIDCSREHLTKNLSLSNGKLLNWHRKFHFTAIIYLNFVCVYVVWYFHKWKVDKDEDEDEEINLSLWYKNAHWDFVENVKNSSTKPIMCT